jgi:hypothetical protein
MCDCDLFDRPKLFKESVRKARKRHQCCECRGFIEANTRYWESRGNWDGSFSAFRTCGSCYIVGHTLLDCYCFGDLIESLDNCLGFGDREQDSEARVAYAGMLKRKRKAARILKCQA